MKSCPNLKTPRDPLINQQGIITAKYFDDDYTEC